MTRFEVLLLQLSTVLLALSGLVYAGMHYLMTPSDPFAVVNHPWEPLMLKSHILLAPLLVLACGIVIHSHILTKLRNGARVGKTSGIGMITVFGVMVFSGYALQVSASGAHRVWMWLHLISGVLWLGFFAIHQVSAFLMKRSMAGQNGSPGLLPSAQMRSRIREHATLP